MSQDTSVVEPQEVPKRTQSRTDLEDSKESHRSPDLKLNRSRKSETNTSNEPERAVITDFEFKGLVERKRGYWTVLAHSKSQQLDVIISAYTIPDDADFDVTRFLDRINTIRGFRHEHLSIPLQVFTHQSQLWMVYPRTSNNSVDGMIASHYPVGLDEILVREILIPICLGVQYLHSHHIAHRNLSLPNIKFDRDRGRILLSGFGSLKTLSSSLSSSKPVAASFVLEQLDREVSMSDEKISPLEETNRGEVESNGVGGDTLWLSYDVFHIGIIALHLAYGTPPSLQKMTQLIESHEPFNPSFVYDRSWPFGETDTNVNRSDSFSNLISQCLTWNAKQRPSIAKILSHGWIRRSSFFNFDERQASNESFLVSKLTPICRSIENQVLPHARPPVVFMNEADRSKWMNEDGYSEVFVDDEGEEEHRLSDEDVDRLSLPPRNVRISVRLDSFSEDREDSFSSISEQKDGVSTPPTRRKRHRVILSRFAVEEVDSEASDSDVAQTSPMLCRESSQISEASMGCLDLRCGETIHNLRQENTRKEKQIQILTDRVLFLEEKLRRYEKDARTVKNMLSKWDDG